MVFLLTGWLRLNSDHLIYNTFSLIIGKCKSALPHKTKCLCLSAFFFLTETNRDRGQKRSAHRQKVTHWLPVPRGHLHTKEMISIRRWTRLNPQHWSQLYSLLRRDGRKTSEAVSGSAAIKPTRGLCFLLLLASHSNIGFFCVSDQTNEIFLKYHYSRRDTVQTKQSRTSNKVFYSHRCGHPEGICSSATQLNRVVLKVSRLKLTNVKFQL